VLGDQSSSVRFLMGAGNFSLHHCIQNGSGAHPATYPTLSLPLPFIKNYLFSCILNVVLCDAHSLPCTSYQYSNTDWILIPVTAESEHL